MEMPNNSWQCPIFVLGNPRSGTSLLRLMLNSHPEIIIPPESHFFLFLEEKYGKWSMNKLDDYLTDLFNATKFETWQIDRDKLVSFLETQTILNYAHLTSMIYYFYAKKQQREVKYWGDKNSLWTSKLSEISAYYPEAFFIHIIRDGRDVACSYRKLKERGLKSKYAPNLPYEVSEIAKIWSENVEAVESHLQTVDTSKKVTVLYKDLILQPKRTLESILNKLELTVVDDQLNFYKKSKSQIEPDLYFDWKEKLQSPLDKTNIGKFKKFLSNDDISIFNDIAKNTLTRFGYL
ncbi:MAG: sulfotransferase [Algicola sp.]|nr:sulfotransferase [Algicola sp.]